MTGCILGIAADLPREGMRDVDKKLDLLITAMGCKPFGTSESAADCRHRKRRRVRCRPCE